MRPILPFLVAAASILGSAADYQVLIRNARVVDGSGNPWFRADVGIKDGKIARIGQLANATADRTIDAAGRILTPGFVDVHTHIERAIFIEPRADAFLRNGVTSVVTGNCGASATDMKTFFGRLEKSGIGLNIAALIGHNAVRTAVMGGANRAPSAEEQKKMNEMVAQGMRDGAVGFSTGLWYVPGTYAQTREVVDMAKAAAAFGGVYATHMRDEGVSVEDAIREAVHVGKEANMPVQISHFKIIDRRHWGKSAKTLQMVEEARKGGLDVVVDQYPYTAASATIDIFFPRDVLADGPSAIVERLTSPESRKRIAAQMNTELTLRQGQHDYSFAVIADSPEDRSLEGKTISEINIARGRSKSLANEIETLIDMRTKGRPYIVYHVMSDEDVDRIMKHPLSAVASDAVMVPFGEAVPHPRNYGTNARVLSRYVRERGILTLEEAIRKMTSLPARTFNLRDRGLVREGFAADLVLFDPAKVKDQAEFSKPHQYSTGFDYVLVNGSVAVEDGKPNTVRQGRILRHQ
ncbi:MAG TPA: D-aminoacylase [Bryobacteraceae bacterium]|nr:D-aminoacylase [Bryobacteraceae bacterium]